MSLITPFYESYYISNTFREQLDQLLTYLIRTDKTFDVSSLVVTDQDRTYLRKDLEYLHENLKVNLYSENPLKMKIPKYMLMDVITNYLTGNNPYGFTIGKGYFGSYLELVLKPEYKPYIEYLLHPQKQDHFIFPEITLTLFSVPVKTFTPMAYTTYNGKRTFITLNDPSDQLTGAPMYSTLENILRVYSEIMANTDLPYCVKRVQVNEMVNQLKPITHQSSYPVLSISRKAWTGEDVGLQAYAGDSSLSYLKRDRVHEIATIFGVYCVVDIEVLSNPIRYNVRLDVSETPFVQERLDNLDLLPSLTFSDTKELSMYIEYTLIPKVLEVARPRTSIGELYQIKRQFDDFNKVILTKLDQHVSIID